MIASAIVIVHIYVCSTHPESRLCESVVKLENADIDPSMGYPTL